MSRFALGYPRILHTTPGRLRVRLPDEALSRHAEVETSLRQIPGVTCARVNPLTGNALIHFDTRLVGQEDVIASLASLVPCPPRGQQAEPTATANARRPGVVHIGGAAVRAGLLAASHLAGRKGAAVRGKRLAAVAGGIGLLQESRVVAGGLSGSNLPDLVFSGASILANLLSASPLRLALAGVEAFLVFWALLAQSPEPPAEQQSPATLPMPRPCAA